MSDDPEDPKPPGPQYPTGVGFHTAEGAYTDTQVEAARKIFKDLAKRQKATIRWMVHRGARGGTGYELAQDMKGLMHAWEPRLTELKLAGTIVDSGRRQSFGARGPFTVWVLARYPVFHPPPNITAAARKENEACARIAEGWSPIAAQAIRDRMRTRPAW